MLKIEVEGCDDIVAGNGLAGHALGGFFAIGTECDLQKTRLAAEFAVENLLDALAPLALREDEVVVFNRPEGERRLGAGVSDDMSGERAVGVEAHIGLP